MHIYVYKKTLFGNQKKPYTNHSQLTMNLKSMKFRAEKKNCLEEALHTY